MTNDKPPFELEPMDSDKPRSGRTTFRAEQRRGYDRRQRRDRRQVIRFNDDRRSHFDRRRENVWDSQHNF